MRIQQAGCFQSLLSVNDSETPLFLTWCELRKSRLIQQYGFSYHRHRVGCFCTRVGYRSSVVTFDSTLLGKLFYAKLLKLDLEEPKKEKVKKNIHQQLEEKPDEFSDDSDGRGERSVSSVDSDQSVVYKNDMVSSYRLSVFVWKRGGVHSRASERMELRSLEAYLGRRRSGSR